LFQKKILFYFYNFGNMHMFDDMVQVVKKQMTKEIECIPKHANPL